MYLLQALLLTLTNILHCFTTYLIWCTCKFSNSVQFYNNDIDAEWALGTPQMQQNTWGTTGARSVCEVFIFPLNTVILYRSSGESLSRTVLNAITWFRCFVVSLSAVPVRTESNTEKNTAAVLFCWAETHWHFCTTSREPPCFCFIYFSRPTSGFDVYDHVTLSSNQIVGSTKNELKNGGKQCKYLYCNKFLIFSLFNILVIDCDVLQVDIYVYLEYFMKTKKNFFFIQTCILILFLKIGRNKT